MGRKWNSIYLLRRARHPPSRPPLTPALGKLPHCPDQTSHCALLSLSPCGTHSCLVSGQAPDAHLIQSRSVGISLVSCEVFLRVAFLQSRLGAQDLQESGKTRFPRIPGTCPRPSQTITPRPTASDGANCPAQGHPAQMSAGSRPLHLPGHLPTGVLYAEPHQGTL